MFLSGPLFVFVFKNSVNAHSFIYFSDGYIFSFNTYIFSFNTYYFQESNHPCFFENGPFACNRDLAILIILEYASTI